MAMSPATPPPLELLPLLVDRCCFSLGWFCPPAELGEPLLLMISVGLALGGKNAVSILLREYEVYSSTASVTITLSVHYRWYIL